MKNGWKKAISLLMAGMLCAASTAALAEDAVQVILNAGTTQAFTADEVAEDDLNTILTAGLSATSAINQQPWYFVVVTNQDVMNEISGSVTFGGAAPVAAADEDDASSGESASSGASAASTTAKAALGDSPVAIIIYMDESTASPNASFDCGLACQNMVIAANALGYGTKIVSSPTIALNGDNHDALCETLGVDPSLNAVAVLLIGMPDATVDGTTSASVRSELGEKVSFVK